MDENLTSVPSVTPTDTPAPEVPESRAKLVQDWLSKIKSAAKYWEQVFKRMRECQQLAVHGADKSWIDAGNYVVPIIPRHINQMVSLLYAKDPRAVATRRKTLMYQIWDGKNDTLQAALQVAGQAVMTGMEVPFDAAALLNEVKAAEDHNRMVDRMAKSLEILWSYYTAEQASGFKQQMKALVRRAKVNGVGYVKLGYQRILEPRPDVAAKIADATSQIQTIERLLEENAQDPFSDDNKKLEELRLLLQDLQSQQMLIVREGPVFSFPQSTRVIVDPCCTHLKTFTGAGWVAEEFDLTPEEVREIYKVDVGKTYTPYSEVKDPVWAQDKGKDKENKCRVYEVQDAKRQQCFVVCDGYPDFLVEPKAPDVKIERFWTIFALVFNEVESEDDLFPPSDVWLMRHTQAEYNRARQGLREHRVANRPKYFAAQGALEEVDKQKLTSAPAHAIIELSGMQPNEDVSKKVQRLEMVAIDPNQYQVEEHYKDMLRTAGSQEANLGATAGATATESSIAEQSRMSSVADNVDDLDDVLTDLAKATGQLMMLELAKETVDEIVGPGSVWPEAKPTREEINKDLLLTIKAGSSGRPNKASELANMERAAPYLMQMPGVNPEPLVRKYADHLDIDVDELYVAGMPSIMAVNAALGKAAAQPATGNPETNPGDQGAQGATNAPNPEANEPQPQPAYPDQGAVQVA